jgi:hypothetical protein
MTDTVNTVIPGGNVHFNRASYVILANALKRKIKSLLSYFRGSVALHALKHSRNDQIRCVVSQLVGAYARSECLAAGAG